MSVHDAYEFDDDNQTPPLDDLGPPDDPSTVADASAGLTVVPQPPNPIADLPPFNTPKEARMVLGYGSSRSRDAEKLDTIYARGETLRRLELFDASRAEATTPVVFGLDPRGIVHGAETAPPLMSLQPMDWSAPSLNVVASFGDLLSAPTDAPCVGVGADGWSKDLWTQLIAAGVKSLRLNLPPNTPGHPEWLEAMSQAGVAVEFLDGWGSAPTSTPTWRVQPRYTSLPGIDLKVDEKGRRVVTVVHHRDGSTIVTPVLDFIITSFAYAGVVGRDGVGSEMVVSYETFIDGDPREGSFRIPAELSREWTAWLRCIPPELHQVAEPDRKVFAKIVAGFARLAKFEAQLRHPSCGWARDDDGTPNAYVASNGATTVDTFDSAVRSVGGDDSTTGVMVHEEDTRGREKEIIAAARGKLRILSPRYRAVILATVTLALVQSRFVRPVVLQLAGDKGAGKTFLLRAIQCAFGRWGEAVLAADASLARLNGEMALYRDFALGVDDLAPTADGSTRQLATLEAFVRQASNRRGHQRSWQDGTPRPDQRPEVIVMFTGEELLQTPSAVDRTLGLKVTRAEFCSSPEVTKPDVERLEGELGEGLLMPLCAVLTRHLLANWAEDTQQLAKFYDEEVASSPPVSKISDRPYRLLAQVVAAARLFDKICASHGANASIAGSVREAFEPWVTAHAGVRNTGVAVVLSQLRARLATGDLHLSNAANGAALTASSFFSNAAGDISKSLTALLPELLDEIDADVVTLPLVLSRLGCRTDSYDLAQVGEPVRSSSRRLGTLAPDGAVIPRRVICDVLPEVSPAAEQAFWSELETMLGKPPLARPQRDAGCANDVNRPVGCCRRAHGQNRSMPSCRAGERLGPSAHRCCGARAATVLVHVASSCAQALRSLPGSEVSGRRRRTGCDRQRYGRGCSGW